ncbi:DUF308 domain-containing protein [Brevibacterium litoralis]|uniref:DUF308 domain-containing protein n=1 Tax=Brevibacterium litoralis TaxID=3138935 RepID=UPI0032EF925A
MPVFFSSGPSGAGPFGAAAAGAGGFDARQAVASRFMRRLWWTTLLRGLALALLGLGALLWPGAATTVLVTLVGVYLLLEAVFSVFRAVVAARTGTDLVRAEDAAAGAAPGTRADAAGVFGVGAYGPDSGPVGPAPHRWHGHAWRALGLALLGVVLVLLPGLVGTVAVLGFLYVVTFGLGALGLVTIALTRAVRRAGASGTGLFLAGGALAVVLAVALFLTILLAPTTTALVVVQIVSVLVLALGVTLAVVALKVRTTVRRAEKDADGRGRSSGGPDSGPAVITEL